MAFQVFVSYARRDNLVPVGSDATFGFVDLIQANLPGITAQIGPGDIAVWQDVHRIRDGEQFNEVIRAAIEASDLLLVVLTENWLDRPYCRQELDAFSERWKGDPQFAKRFVVVLRTEVDIAKRPSELQGQVGYQFYDVDANGKIVPHYAAHGKPREAFYAKLDELGAFVRDRAVLFGAVPPVGAVPSVAGPSSVDAAPGAGTVTGAGLTPGAFESTAGRTVYVAEAAPDMAAARRTVVAQLTAEGVRVLPEAHAGPSAGNVTPETLRAALEQAQFSVHFLGEADRIEDGVDHIRLELEAAAARAERDATSKGFKRIIFAPKRLDSGLLDEASTQREPLDVRKRFGRSVAGDTVFGDGIEDFVLALTTQLATRGAQPQADANGAAPELKAGQAVYVDFDRPDAAYAVALVKAFRARGIVPHLAAIEGSRKDLKLANEPRLLESDAVVYCWANAKDSWLYSAARENDTIKRRSRPFKTRAAIVGPPDQQQKDAYDPTNPPPGTDTFLDLRDSPLPHPDGLDPLIAELS